MTPRPLDGFRILDVTNVLSGPFCGYQLGLLGAEIIKVESPDGDLARQLGAHAQWNAQHMGVSFLAQNAGKRSISLNLKTDAGRNVFLDLVATCDAVIENFRPGVMDRLGLGYDELIKVQDPLVYCAITGFGQQGPMANQPAYDQIVQGLSGVMGITGDAESGPLRVGYPVADTIGGLTAALAIVAALHQKQSQYIDVSMLESVLTTMGWVASNWLMADQVPTRLGNDNMTAAPSGAFRTQDGLINIAANQDRQWVALTNACGLDHLLHDPRFADREARKQHRHALTELIEEVFRSYPTVHWVNVLSDAGVPVGPVLGVHDALDLDQVQARQFISTLHQDYPAEEIRLVTNGFLINNTRLTPIDRVETLGESTHDVLRELGYELSQIEQLEQQGVIR
jgi:CoA:oxalate CoA-transferase